MAINRLPNEITPWREPPFIVGSVYRIRRSFDTFEAGELLTYVGDACSLYDEMTGYFFRDASGENRRWDISDNDDLGRWEQLFEFIADSVV